MTIINSCSDNPSIDSESEHCHRHHHISNMPSLITMSSNCAPPLLPGPPSVSRCAWVPGLCGGPDVPAAAQKSPPSPPDDPWDVSTWESDQHPSPTSSSPSTLLSPLSSDAAATQYREEVITKILELKDVKPVKISFNVMLTERTQCTWETMLQGDTLYMTVPPILGSGSKEAFITLLEFSEERLQCSRCILCIRKNRADRAALLRTFMFMGFQLMAPGSLGPAAPAPRPEYLYMVYNIE